MPSVRNCNTTSGTHGGDQHAANGTTLGFAARTVLFENDTLRTGIVLTHVSAIALCSSLKPAALAEGTPKLGTTCCANVGFRSIELDATSQPGTAPVKTIVEASKDDNIALDGCHVGALPSGGGAWDMLLSIDMIHRVRRDDVDHRTSDVCRDEPSLS